MLKLYFSAVFLIPVFLCITNRVQAQQYDLKDYKHGISVSVPWVGIGYSYFPKPKHALEALVRFEPKGWFLGADYAYHLRLTFPSNSSNSQRFQMDVLFGAGVFYHHWALGQQRDFLPANSWQESAGIFPLLGIEGPLTSNRKLRLRANMILNRFYFDGHNNSELRNEINRKTNLTDIFSSIFYSLVYTLD